MAHTGRPELSSIFNDLLAQNRKQFDALYRRGRPHAGEPSAAARSAVAEPRGAVPPSPTPSILLDPQSPAIRRLNERFGNDWRYEIAEQRRDGEEAIVLCKLIFGKEGTVRTQFGRTNFSHGPVVGTSSGLRFRLDIAGAGKDDRDAFRRAAEAALLNCLDQS